MTLGELIAPNAADSPSATTPQTPVDPEAITTDSLEALQSHDQRKIMDIVDKLRRTGLNGVVQLPQLVVCGDQSSGKSSVLEAITEIPFPRKENLCTRFATEIVLRRDHTPSISTRITPDKFRPAAKQEELRAFRKSIHDFSELPALIEEATSLMGLGEVGQGHSRAFSRDVLSIEICGPGRPQLTLVDLPGLIHSENKAQTKQDVELIHNLVEEYISNERTIILAVISAKNDYANQIILERCQKIDKSGSRTMGIITKPDFLRPGSENEKDWINLAKNRDIYFELGWHMLKNRADEELNTTFQERNASESLFFSKGRYQDLSRDMVGIESLKTRLSQLLNNHLTKELPHLKEDIDAKLQETTESLERLGKRRTNIPEQRMFLTGISTTVYDILRASLNGHYGDPFFGAMELSAAVDSAENIRRFRAVIQHLNIQFAEKIRRYGSKYRIDPPTKSTQASDPDYAAELSSVATDPELGSEASDEDDIFTPLQKKMSRPSAVSWVLKVLQRSRGCELPGNFNPMLISQLFWEQSEPWKDLAMEHIERVAGACNRFVKTVLQHAASPEIESRLLRLHIDAALESSLSASRAELAKIIADKARHPMTYNHYYTTTIQKIRQEKYGNALIKLAEEAEVSVERKNYLPGPGYTTQKYIDPKLLREQVDSHIEQNMDKFSAEEALDCHIAYYKDELKYFIGAVTKQVIERHLVDTLPSTILSPMVIAGLSDDEIRFVAAERAEVTQQRMHLEAKREMLEKGLATFRSAMGGSRF